ncbi:MAG: hypothetical protein V3T84_05955 [Phycisphaerales bacterium]
MVGGTIGGIILFLLGLVVAGLVVAFVLVPLLKGIGWLIAGVFKGIGWVIAHIFQFITGMLKDSVRFVGSLIAMIVLMPLVLLNIVIGRWSAAGHFGKSMKREFSIGSTCIYRVALQRPLRLVLLGGLLEGVEERVNEAMINAPTSDKPSRRTGTFDGYTIIGSLPGGGSGAKLYIAQPDDAKRARNSAIPERVVIKSFTLTDGSSLPQIIRESRALEAAKQLGLVLEHDLDEHRFFYVMPYHEGDHLGLITRQMHGKSDANGLDVRQLGTVFGYVEDLLGTLAEYHRGGLWHKDVKPENIIIHDGEAHLVDLGLVTPLRSAMTLTTHGTEYFRDPEMVRMALRGVKVHQVDGAKFDIYAVGAVLYFITESTFPAHGGLSAFNKRSPEAMRWIIRRSMADYNKRYETADQMLADLRYLSSAHDPFSVKPAQLPSLAGSGHGQFVVDQAGVAHVVASAGSPKPPNDPAEAADVRGWGVSVGPQGVHVGSFPSPAAQPAQPSRGRRPLLRVTNWWTGAYDVDDAGEASVARQPAGPQAAVAVACQQGAKVFREQARAFRADTAALRQQMRDRMMSPRRAAREQIKAARARAKEIRNRTRSHLRRRHSEHRPTPVMGLFAVAFILAFVCLWLPLNRRSTSVTSSQGLVVAPYALPAPPPEAAGRAWLFLNDHPAATNPRVQVEIQKVLGQYRGRGWRVLTDDADIEVAVRKFLPTGQIDPDRPLPPLLRKTILDNDLAGILRITAKPGEGAPHERIDWALITALKLKDGRPLIGEHSHN